MPEKTVNAEVNGRELSVLQKQNEDSERQMAVSSNHANITSLSAATVLSWKETEDLLWFN